MSTAEIRYEWPDKVFLFGGGEILHKFGLWLVEQDIRVYAYTAPRQANIGHVAKVVEDINVAFKVKEVTPTTLGICFGPAWQFGPEIRNAFGNRLIDFMSIPYPAYLGGAHITHAILRNESQWGCCLQLVTENTKQGLIHDGRVIARHNFMFGKNQEVRDGKCLDFLKEWCLSTKGSRRALRPRPDYKESEVFFPRLNTVKNGWIDWGWTGNHIVRFVKAFDWPYPGSRTYLSGNIVVVRSAIMYAEDDYSEHCHPFHNGIILRCEDENVIVSVQGGLLRLKLLSENSDKLLSGDQVQPGNRLHTPRHILEEALLYQPNYGPNGDEACKQPWIATPPMGTGCSYGPSDGTTSYSGMFRGLTINKSANT